MEKTVSTLVRAEQDRRLRTAATQPFIKPGKEQRFFIRFSERPPPPPRPRVPRCRDRHGAAPDRPAPAYAALNRPGPPCTALHRPSPPYASSRAAGRRRSFGPARQWGGPALRRVRSRPRSGARSEKHSAAYLAFLLSSPLDPGEARPQVPLPRGASPHQAVRSRAPRQSLQPPRAFRSLHSMP